MTPDESHCLDQLSAYIDDVVDDAERRSIEAHLTRCPECERRCQELLHIRKVLRDSPVHLPSEALYFSVIKRSGMARKVTWRRMRVPLKAIAAFCFLLVAFWFGVDKILKHQLTLIVLDFPRQVFKIAVLSTATVATDEVSQSSPTIASVVEPSTTTVISASIPVETINTTPRPTKPAKKSSKKKARVNIQPKETRTPLPQAAETPVAESKTPTKPALLADLPADSQVVKPSDLVEWKGADSKIQKKRTYHIRSAANLNNVWRRHAPGEPIPIVNFDVYDVVGVTFGQTHVKGQGVEIMGTRTTTDFLIVYYREPSDLFRQESSMASHTPYHFKVIPKSDLPVQFQKI